MSIVSEIERIKTNIANAYIACEGKGATMPSILNSANLYACIASITGSETPTNEYISGVTALWAGEDGLNENNQWVDRINGYTFTPMQSSVVPVYNSERKLLDFNAYGGIQCDLSLPATAEVQYTIELVLRDMDESSGSGTKWGKILGPEMTNSYNKASSYSINGNWNNNNNPTGRYNSYGIDYYNSSLQETNHVSISQRAHGLTTITVIPTKGLWINGVKEVGFNLSCVSTQFALGSAIGSKASNSKTQFKTHGFRYYPMELTEEQILHNYNVDVSIYGE